MPGPKRSPRCAWTEAGNRCRRTASGADGLCNAHRIAAQHVAEAHQQGARPFGAGMAAALDDFLSGRRVSEQNLGAALEDLAWAMGGGYGPHHETFPDDGADHAGHGHHGHPGFHPPNGQRLPPNWRPRQPPPPPDPKLEERRAARRVLGFPDGVAITEEMVSARRKELARRHHPDRGGSVDQMQRINAAADLLLESLA